MGLGIDMKLVQQQKLVMTVEMQQSIKLLEMSSYELLKYIDKELQENILLSASGPEKKDELYYFQGNDEEKVSPFEFISSKATLKDYLYEQLMEEELDEQTAVITRYIIESLDSRGYVYEQILDDIVLKYKVSSDKARQALMVVQRMNPLGIGSRNIKECLLIQAERLGYKDLILEEIIKNYLSELSRGNYKVIAKKINTSPGRVQEAEETIRHMEPKPSRGFFTGENTCYIIPDVNIVKINNFIEAVPDDEIIPNLYINHEYDTVSSCGDEEAEKFIKAKADSANALIKAVQARKNTLCRVVGEIVRIQEDFIAGREEDLKPMTIKDISTSLELHESTVSRAVKDKYVSLPGGEIMAVRKFFSVAVNDKNNEISSDGIKTRIKRIIDGESINRPYSDAEIGNQLLEEGINISRRTVAKYREEMGIRPSTKRRKME